MKDPRTTIAVLNIDLEDDLLGSYWIGYRKGYLLSVEGPAELDGYDETASDLERLEDLLVLLQARETPRKRRDLKDREKRIQQLSEDMAAHQAKLKNFDPEAYVYDKSLKASDAWLKSRRYPASQPFTPQAAYAAGLVNGWVRAEYEQTPEILGQLTTQQKRTAATQTRELQKQGRVPRPRPTRGSSVPKERRTFVYLMACEGVEPVKIGVALSPRQRALALQTGSPGKIAVVWQQEGTRALENAIHRELDEYRVRGEWFDLTSLGDPVEVVRKTAKRLEAQFRKAGHLSQYFYEDDE
ncbi:GIY-YIG nuclease family protein [Streptomyces sp. NPDC021212]|uniref:GIY-YIG nuclease family protein n=1 Tax=Streptomyces sp. NPDC021212 TaxID=3365118 RepID=UPI0037A412E9